MVVAVVVTAIVRLAEYGCKSTLVEFMISCEYFGAGGGDCGGDGGGAGGDGSVISGVGGKYNNHYNIFLNTFTTSIKMPLPHIQ